jgi:hypothetical protein
VTLDPFVREAVQVGADLLLARDAEKVAVRVEQAWLVGLEFAMGPGDSFLEHCLPKEVVSDWPVEVVEQVIAGRARA